MTIRKITVDNSVRYVPKVKNQKKKRFNQKHLKLVHSFVKKDEKLSQNNEKWVASGFGILK